MKYILAPVSNATIIEILGWTCLPAAELVLPWSHHLRQRKEVSFNQDSSMLMILLPEDNKSISLMVNCDLRTRFYSEFPWKGIFFIFLYFMPRSSRKIFQICWFVTSNLWSILTRCFTWEAFVMAYSYLKMAIISEEMIVRLLLASSFSYLSSFRKLILFLAFLMR